MKITFDPAKRTWTLRGFDFDDALAVFAGSAFTFENDRFDYAEIRFVTVGRLRSDGRRGLDTRGECRR